MNAQDVSQILSGRRADFPSLNRTFRDRPLTYFDGPAGTQMPKRVIESISGYYNTCNANTHGCFITTRESDALLEDTRRVIATYLGAKHLSCISLGANMTTLNYSLSKAIGRALKAGDEVVITQLDHEANRGPWLTLTERGIVWRVEIFDLGEKPQVSILSRKLMLDPEDELGKQFPRGRTKPFVVHDCPNRRRADIALTIAIAARILARCEGRIDEDDPFNGRVIQIASQFYGHLPGSELACGPIREPQVHVIIQVVVLETGSTTE